MRLWAHAAEVSGSDCHPYRWTLHLSRAYVSTDFSRKRGDKAAPSERDVRVPAPWSRRAVTLFSNVALR